MTRDLRAVAFFVQVFGLAYISRNFSIPSRPPLALVEVMLRRAIPPFCDARPRTSERVALGALRVANKSKLSGITRRKVHMNITKNTKNKSCALKVSMITSHLSMAYLNLVSVSRWIRNVAQREEAPFTSNKRQRRSRLRLRTLLRTFGSRAMAQNLYMELSDTNILLTRNWTSMVGLRTSMARTPGIILSRTSLTFVIHSPSFVLCAREIGALPIQNGRFQSAHLRSLASYRSGAAREDVSSLGNEPSALFIAFTGQRQKCKHGKRI